MVNYVANVYPAVGYGRATADNGKRVLVGRHPFDAEQKPRYVLTRRFLPVTEIENVLERR